jgi:hypothetical protein
MMTTVSSAFGIFDGQLDIIGRLGFCKVLQPLLKLAVALLKHDLLGGKGGDLRLELCALLGLLGLGPHQRVRARLQLSAFGLDKSLFLANLGLPQFDAALDLAANRYQLCPQVRQRLGLGLQLGPGLGGFAQEGGLIRVEDARSASCWVLAAASAAFSLSISCSLLAGFEEMTPSSFEASNFNRASFASHLAHSPQPPLPS